MLRKYNLLFFLSLFITTACIQEEGPGGNSHIEGKLIERVYNEDYSLLLDERPAKDHDIFLLYGNKKSVGRDVETSYNGHFSFEYLWPGNYELFYYSKDSMGIETEVVVPLELKRNQTLNLNELYVNTTLKWNRGTATITGMVYVTNYKNSSSYPNLVIKDVTPAQDKEIFLIYGNSKGVDERVRTAHDGSFEFKNLIKGNYLIYVLSEDVSGGTASIPIKHNVTINKDGEHVDLGIISIEQL